MGDKKTSRASEQHQQAGATRRPDMDPRTVALRWLEGVSILDLATEYEASMETVKRRLKKAREECPDLPWDARKTAERDNATKDYINMNDGDPRARSRPQGSVVLDGKRRRG